MEINWKVIAPFALIVGVIVLYFVRVKPIEGLENADKEFASKLKEEFANLERQQKMLSKLLDEDIKRLNTEDFKAYLKTFIDGYDDYLSLGKIHLFKRMVESDGGTGEWLERELKEVGRATTLRDYARDSLSVLNGTDGQGSGMETSGAIDNSSGTSPSLW